MVVKVKRRRIFSLSSLPLPAKLVPLREAATRISERFVPFLTLKDLIIVTLGVLLIMEMRKPPTVVNESQQCTPPSSDAEISWKPNDMSLAKHSSIRSVWPMPSHVTAGFQEVSISPVVTMVVRFGRESTVGRRKRARKMMKRAFQRFRKVVFKYGYEDEEDDVDGRRDDVAGSVEKVQVSIRSPEVELQMEMDESYALEVPGDRSQPITLQANTTVGALRGLESLSQLCHFNFTSRAVTVTNVPMAIHDRPRFNYRGLLVDTARHFQPLLVLEQILDSMAYAKLNVLHWHLTDNESFAIETPSFPRLWEASFSPFERYSLQDMRHVVRYAADRGITVIPEVDTPAHAVSWGLAYPQLFPAWGCRTPLDISRNFTFQVIEGVLRDLRSVFTAPLIHIGGDEVSFDCWVNVTHVAAWMREKNLTSQQAHVHFVHRVQEIAIKAGWKKTIVWEETFLASDMGETLDPKITIVQNWLDTVLAFPIVENGFPLIFSNGPVGLYLDVMENSWRMAYEVEVQDRVNANASRSLLVGGEACAWGETIDASNALATIWPRAAALAERLWSPYEFFEPGNDQSARMHAFRCLLLQRGVQASPADTELARSPPGGPGSCFVQ